jgi:hypothetical protein
VQAHDAFALFAELNFYERLQFLKKIDSNELIGSLRYLMTPEECSLHPYIEPLTLHKLHKLLHISLSEHRALHD